MIWDAMMLMVWYSCRRIGRIWYTKCDTPYAIKTYWLIYSLRSHVAKKRYCISENQFSTPMINIDTNLTTTTYFDIKAHPQENYGNWIMFFLFLCATCLPQLIWSPDINRLPCHCIQWYYQTTASAKWQWVLEESKYPKPQSRSLWQNLKENWYGVGTDIHCLQLFSSKYHGYTVESLTDPWDSCQMQCH